VGTQSVPASGRHRAVHAIAFLPALAIQEYVYWGCYQQFGGSPGRVREHVVRHPISSVAELFSPETKRRTIDLMLRSFLYLPVLSWTMWPMLFTAMAERFWSISPNLWLFHAQYQVIMTAVLFVSTLYMKSRTRGHGGGPR
jgi:hypothetical protein